MVTRVTFWLDYRGTDPWAETKVSFQLHACHGSHEGARAWIVEQLRAGALELFTLLSADGSEWCSAPKR